MRAKSDPAQHEILNEVARLFRAFPAGKNVDEHTLQDYCELVATFEASVVRHVVDGFRLGRIKRTSHNFPPSLAELAQHLRQKAKLAEVLHLHEKQSMGGRDHGAHNKRNYILPPNHFQNRHINTAHTQKKES